MEDVVTEEAFEECSQEKVPIKKEALEKEKVTEKEVLEFALEAGRVLLKNGAEIFRVEETIEHICKRFNINKVDTFIMSNGIFITAECEGEEFFAKVKHVPLSGIHLGIVTEVNDLSRDISAGNIGLEEAVGRLKEIEKLPAKRSIIRIFSAGLGSGCFCYLLNGRGNFWASVLAFLIGMLLYVFVIFSERHHMSKIIVNIVGGGMITVLAIIASITFPFATGLDQMIIGSIMPLIPGVAFTNAIRDIANSDFISGTVRMIDALLVFVYIAIGVGFILACYYNIMEGMGIVL